ncbi:MAG: hypothetical protein IPK63_16045 [Candidatus Competibacteraceae bacterium]|nr:hypothetical protein [Candidatus Competibacteraceae bacterium]
MSTSPANFHDWEYERESEKEFKRDTEQRANDIADAISERIRDLDISSGHGKAEQALMQRVLDELFRSTIATEQLRRYLFELWKQRDAQDKKNGPRGPGHRKHHRADDSGHRVERCSQRVRRIKKPLGATTPSG